MNESKSFRAAFREDRLPFFAALGFGLAAHGFWLTNKLPFDDDLPNFFTKGATWVSGRYGLELLRLVMPDVSMPWIYGLMSLCFLALAVCLTVRLFHIESRALRVLLAGALVCFSAEGATMGYAFTAAPYALALLLSVAGVWCFASDARGKWVLAPLMIAFSCSVYQGYFAFAASFCVIGMLRALVTEGKSARDVFLYGLRLLGLLLLSLALYGLAVLAATKLLGLPLLGEAVNARQSLALRTAVAYSAWLKTLFRGYFAYVPTPLSLALHVLLLLAAGASLLLRLRGERNAARIALLALLLFLFPLSCYCLYLMADNAYIHSLALYPFASLYVLCAVLLDAPAPPAGERLRAAASLALAGIVLGGAYFSNALGLYAKLQYEETKALYTSVLARVFSLPDFDAACRVAIVGNAPAARWDAGEKFPFEKLRLPGVNITDTRQAEDLIRLYLGCGLPFASEAEIDALVRSGALDGMPVWPYDGSVKRIGDLAVVNFAGETP